MSKIVLDYVVPDRVVRDDAGTRKLPMPPLSISLLRAMTPPSLRGYDIVTRCHDEHTMGPYDVQVEKPDVVAVSALTTAARRAYTILSEARETLSWQARRVRSLIGGIHASALPLEAIHYADGVVRGETPPALLASALDWTIRQIEEDGDERRVFEHDINAGTEMLEPRPIPDRSWYDPGHFLLPYTLQTSVGCPFDCSFCSVTYEFGMKQRHPDYADLEAEIASLPRRLTGIIDDNFLPTPRGEHARQVCELMRRYRIPWVTELTALTLHKNWRELVPLFSRSCCVGLYMGIESITARLAKSAPLQHYRELIDCIHDHGMGVLGAFVFGVNDDEGPETFEETVAWASRAKLDYAQFSINTPEPGARDYEHAVRSNLITDWNWEHYDAEHPVRRFARITQEQMYQGLRNAYRWFYGFSSLRQRMLGQFGDLVLKGSPSCEKRDEFLWKRLKNMAFHSSVGLYLRGTANGWSRRTPVEEYRAGIDPEPNPLVAEQLGPGSVPDQYDARTRMRELRGELAKRTAQILRGRFPLTVTGSSGAEEGPAPSAPPNGSDGSAGGCSAA